MSIAILLSILFVVIILAIMWCLVLGSKHPSQKEAFGIVAMLLCMAGAIDGVAILCVLISILK